jgi:D-sedoheptulose 7-phosphate isomerase
MNFKEYKEYFKAYIDLISEVEIISFIDVLSKHKLDYIYTVGNGGSFSAASHFAQDLVKSCGFRASCLMDNTSMLTAYSNDNGYDKAAASVLDMFGLKNDVLVAISGSGNSANIINAVKLAKREGLFVVGLTGFDGGKLREMSDISIHVNLSDMETVESIHSFILHYISIKLKQ